MSNNIHILYIDDEPILLDLVKGGLERTDGYHVTTAVSAADAIGLLSEKKFDAIVSDYEMPKMNGIQLLKHLREKGDSTPFIIYTGKGREEVVIEAINSGADFYLQKGGKPKAQYAELSNKIYHAVSRKRAEEELLRKNEELHAAYEEISATEEELRLNLNRMIQQESILRLSEERLLMAQEIGQIGCWEYNPNTDKIWSSAEGLHIFGFPPVAGDFPINEIEICISERERVHQALVDLITFGMEYNLEYLIHPSDGSASKIIHSVARLEKDELGNLLRVRGIIHDITQRKEVENELLKKNSELKVAYNHISRAEEEVRGQYNILASIEENLRQTKEFLENLISIANVPIIVWDPSFRITRLNHAFELLVGRSAEEVIGNSLKIMFPPDQAGHSLRQFQTTLDKAGWDTTEIDIMHRDGSLRTLLWNSATLYTQDGLTPVATIAQGRDITGERRLGQEKDAALFQIQQNLAYLAILNDEIRNPLTIIVTYADMLEDSRVVDQIIAQVRRIDEMVNNLDRRWIESEKVLSAIRKHYQIHSVYSTGQNISDQLDMALSEIQRENEQPSDRIVGNLIEEEQIQLLSILDSIDALVYVSDMKTYDLLFINRQGRTLFGDIIGQKCYTHIQRNQEEPCSFCTNQLLTDQSGPTGVCQWEFLNTRDGRWYDCRDRAIRWSDGRLVRLEIAIDITTRKHDEEALRNSERKYRQLVEHANDGIVVTQKDKLQLVNPRMEELTGYPKEVLLSLPFLTFIHPDDQAMVMDRYQELLNGRDSPSRYSFRLVRKDGCFLWIEISTVLVEWEGKPAILNFLIDITERKQMEEELRNSEGRLHTLVQTIPDLIWLKDKDGVYLSCNTMFERFFGAKESDIIGKTDYDFVDRKQADFFHEYDMKAIAIGKPSSNEERITFSDDGHSVFLDTIKTPMYDVRGNLIGVLGIGRDITERKRVELELISSQERLKEAHNLAHIGTWDWVIENDSMIWSDEMYNIALKNPSLVAPTFDQHQHFYTPTSWDRLKSAVTRALTTGEPYNLELELIRPDGSIRWTNEFGGVKRDVNGTVIGLQGTVQDITEWKLINNSLHESVERYRILAQNALVGILTCDLDGEITYVNTKILEMLGSQNRMKTKEINLLTFPPLIDSGFTEVLNRTLRDGVSAPSIEFAYTSIWGKTVYYLGHISPLTRDGLVYGAQVILDDITDRKKGEEALRESNQKLRFLTSLTRHDIFNQLSAVELFLNLALQATDPDKIHAYVSHAHQAGEQIEKTIGFTREYENFGIISSGWQRIHRLIESAKDEVSLGDVLIENLIPEDLEVYADPIIRKVFTTLMENAIRHGGKTTKIIFSCSVCDDTLVIVGVDDGVGVHEDEKMYIFDHGYGKHTGIGLFLSREILSITRLSIRECGAPGKGARFEILVPKEKFRTHLVDRE